MRGDLSPRKGLNSKFNGFQPGSLFFAPFLLPARTSRFFYTSQQGLLRSNIVQLDGVAEHNAFRFPPFSFPQSPLLAPATPANWERSLDPAALGPWFELVTKIPDG